MDYKILWLRERIGWMGKHSGYDLLADYASKQWTGTDGSIWIDRKKPLSASRRQLLSGIVKKGKSYLPTYDPQLAIAELKAAWMSYRASGFDLLHVMYVERDYGLTQRWGKRFFKRIVGTVHQPAGLWRIGRHDPRMLSSLDAILTPSSGDVAYLEQFLPERVFFVPHGVDIDFFSPSEEVTALDTVRCIFCGTWLRDIPALANTIDAIIARNPSIQFDLVIPNQSRNDNIELYRIARHSQVTWHSGLSDKKLRSLYRKGSMLLLPLIDSTANNALLESISCGLPIVSSDIGGLRDYTRDSFADLSPMGDIDGLVNAVLRLTDNPQERANRGKAARTFAEEHLNWTRIAAQTIDIYSKVCQW